MHVLIADDHPLFRAALHQAVVQVLPDARVTEAHDVASLRIAAASEPDLILLDLMMPGGGGFAPLAWLRSQYPGIAVMVVSAMESTDIIQRARAFGVAAYVPKSAPSVDLATAVRAVADCGQWFPPGIAGPGRRTPDVGQQLAARLASLTPQQYRVLELVAQGLLNKQIAAQLAIEETTVKAHVSAALAKLGARNRTQASLILRELEIHEIGRVPADGEDF